MCGHECLDRVLLDVPMLDATRRDRYPLLFFLSSLCAYLWRNWFHGGTVHAQSNALGLPLIDSTFIVAEMNTQALSAKNNRSTTTAAAPRRGCKHGGIRSLSEIFQSTPLSYPYAHPAYPYCDSPERDHMAMHNSPSVRENAFA